MSFDARSLERLQQLGRTLPQPLPKPEPAAAAAPATTKRHRVETETNPEALFRELMQVSPDGTVPPHLMDRLRQAEVAAAAEQRQQQRQAPGPSASPSSSRNRSRQQQPLAPSTAAQMRQKRAQDSETQELYTAFQHLLLEDDEEP